LVVTALDFFPIAAPVGSFAAWAYFPRFLIGFRFLVVDLISAATFSVLANFGILIFFTVTFLSKSRNFQVYNVSIRHRTFLIGRAAALA